MATVLYILLLFAALLPLRCYRYGYHYEYLPYLFIPTLASSVTIIILSLIINVVLPGIIHVMCLIIPDITIVRITVAIAIIRFIRRPIAGRAC